VKEETAKLEKINEEWQRIGKQLEMIK